jgi:hypothetical protein
MRRRRYAARTQLRAAGVQRGATTCVLTKPSETIPMEFLIRHAWFCRCPGWKQHFLRVRPSKLLCRPPSMRNGLFRSRINFRTHLYNSCTFEGQRSHSGHTAREYTYSSVVHWVNGNVSTDLRMSKHIGRDIISTKSCFHASL